jgi:hypothetical protein
MTAEDYWYRLDDLKEHESKHQAIKPSGPKSTASDRAAFDPALWHEVFRDLDESVETREALDPDAALLTDEEIAELKRQIEREP